MYNLEISQPGNMHVDDVEQKKQVTKFVALFHVWNVYKQAKPNYIV